MKSIHIMAGVCDDRDSEGEKIINSNKSWPSVLIDAHSGEGVLIIPLTIRLSLAVCPRSLPEQELIMTAALGMYTL